jgi:ElaB/YqjD/DUF883 family membrane-anchored ribosome-binding protein
MTSCPWLRERGISTEGFHRMLDAHWRSRAATAAEALQDAAGRVAEEARARPRESLLLAAGLGFVLGVVLTSARR